MTNDDNERSLTDISAARVNELWKAKDVARVLDLARRVGPEDCVPDAVRGQAFACLRGSRTKLAATGLLELLTHSNEIIRHAAVSAIGDRKHEKFRDALLLTLENDPSARIRTLAGVRVCERPDTSEETLLGLMNGPSGEDAVRRLADRLSRRKTLRGQERFLQPLVDALSKPESRCFAAEGLGMLGLPEAIPHLLRYEDDAGELTRSYVKRALKRLGRSK